MSKRYEIKAVKGQDPELFIYGDIGESWYEDTVAASKVVDQLKEITADNIKVRINSYGGSVTDGIAIYNALSRHDASIEVHIDAVAVSIASLIAMAGDTVTIAENALMMIHAPWGGAYGNSAELREYADVLDIYAEAMASSYVAKSGKSKEEIMSLLTDGKDHWMTAAEAVEAGFADQVNDAQDFDVAAHFDMSRFQNEAPRNNLSFDINMLGGSKDAISSIIDSEDGTATLASMIKENIPEGNTMTDKSKPDASVAGSKTEEEIKAAVLKEQAQRREDIRASFKPHLEHEGAKVLLDEVLEDVTMTPAQANAKLLDYLGTTAKPMASHVEVGESPQDRFKIDATSAIEMKAGLIQHASGNPLASYSLGELARASIEVSGGKIAGSKMEVVGAAFTHSTSDFTNILADVANKSMLKGFDEAEETFEAWTATGTLTDFKEVSRVDVGGFSDLDEVKPGGEYKYGTIGDSGEKIQLVTYGKLFGITRQAIINDDLRAFTGIPMKMGRAAKRKIGDEVYNVLINNPNMSDGVALFHANHSNLLTGAVISTTSVDAMRVAMATQTYNGVTVSPRLAYLIVPVALEGAAKVVAESQFEVGASTKNNTVPNSVRGTFQVISDPRLDAASASNWYGVTSPSMHDTIEVAYLDGNSSPMLEQQDGWNVDGTEFKVRIDAGVKALAYQGMAKNPN